MRTTINIAIIFFLFETGCVTNKVPYQVYLDKDKDSLFLAEYITWNRNESADFLGYYTHGFDYLSKIDTEDVKQLGLILNAKSDLLTSYNINSVLQNKNDSCITLFTKTIKHTRHGRSALVSVMNLVSTVKGKPTQKQAEPDTSLTSIYSEGIINYHYRLAPFYFKHNYKVFNRTIYEGWLVLNGDTIHIKPVKDLRDEQGKMKKFNADYVYWIELIKNDTVYGAINLGRSLKREMYILKDLRETEKIIIAEFLYIAMYN